MAKIFINYRSSDTAAMALLLDDKLSEAFGQDQVFRDDRSIPIAKDYRIYLWSHLAVCEVMLVLVGNHWFDPEPDGMPRIQRKDDFVRQEIERGLELNLLVLPLLIGINFRLKAEDLPESIQPLAFRQYHHIRERGAMDDIKTLISELEVHVPSLKRIKRRPNTG